MRKTELRGLMTAPEYYEAHRVCFALRGENDLGTLFVGAPLDRVLHQFPRTAE